jgi:hypothetical protein
VRASLSMGAGRIPGPLGSGANGTGGSTVNSPGPLGTDTPLTLEEFKRAVRDRQVAYLVAKGRRFIPNVPESDLEIIEGKQRMRTIAAGKCRELLAAVRADLVTAKNSGDPRAKQTTSIVIHSAYRTFTEDTAAWENTFKEHYRKMLPPRRIPATRSGERRCVTW